MDKGTLSHEKATQYIQETLKMVYVFTRDVQKIVDKTEKSKPNEIQF
jgi:hypothetical protein